MDFEGLRELMRDLPVFGTTDVVTVCEQDAASVSVKLHRWAQAGRIKRLRRGLYTLNENDRRAPLTPSYLASVLVEPSYLSGVWVLSQNSVIPEAVFTVTSATRGRKVRFDNVCGRFAYYRLPDRAWFGFSSKEVQGYYLLDADCEKALLDTIYWSGSVWDRKRFQQERVDAHRINEERLYRWAEKWGELKLKRSVAEFKAYKEAQCPIW